MTLMFTEWIKSGLLKVGNLKFNEGTLDENYIYQKVKNKSNIISEVTIVKKALKNYK